MAREERMVVCIQSYDFFVLWDIYSIFRLSCMSSSKAIARLVGVCQKEQVASFDKRQVPINIDENLIVKFLIKFTKKK